MTSRTKAIAKMSKPVIKSSKADKVSVAGRGLS